MSQSSRALAVLLPLLFAIAPVSSQAAQLPIVRLDFVPARTLPGVPVTLVVTITNPGDQPLELIEQVNVFVTPPRGEPFFALDDTSYSPRESFALSPELDSRVVLRPGESRTFVTPADLMSQPQLFLDERLSWPGTYRIRLTVGSGPLGALSTAESNEATLTVIEPQGPDAVVWNRMLALSNGEGWNLMNWIHSAPTLAKEVFTIAPSSGYTPYLAQFKWGQTPAQLREGIEYAISLRPEGPIADSLKGALAGWYAERGEEALANGDLERALELYAESRRRTVEVDRTTAYSWVREYGERWLADPMNSEPVIGGRFAGNVEAMATSTEAVTPFVECVDPGFTNSDPYIVWFGYHNPNTGKRFLEWGKGNDLTPSAPKQQPPRVFLPGRQKYGFSVTTHVDRVTWTVDGTKATAARDTQPRCTYPKVEELGLRPVVDCIRKEGDQVLVLVRRERDGTG